MTKDNAKGLLRDRRGAIGAWVALMLVMLLGMAALAIDMGYLWVLRHRLQATADAAALAGVSPLTSTPDAAVVKAEAVAYAQKNMPPGGHGTVLADPDVVLGHWDGDTRTFTTNATSTAAPAGEVTNAVQVTTRRAQANGNPVGLFLARALGVYEMDVVTEAIAQGRGPEYCVLALEPEKPAITVSGSATFTFDCGIGDHSTHPDKALATSGSVEITADSICVAGGTSSSGFSSVSPVPEPGCTPPPDPLSGLPPPSYSGCDYTNYIHSSSQNVTLSPGVYCGGMNFAGSSANTVATFEPGIYILDGGGLAVSGGDHTFNGTGVMFYNTSSTGSDFKSIQFSFFNTMNFSAPTSGTYAGILFFQDPSPESAAAGVKFVVSGGNVTNFDGAIYFPNHAIIYSGGTSQVNTCSKIIAKTITFSGSSGFQIFGTEGCSSDAVYIGPKLRLVN